MLLPAGGVSVMTDNHPPLFTSFSLFCLQMKYLNPLAFLTKMNGGPVDLRDNAALSLLRKKMLAEVELSDDKLLKLDAQLLSKNDLLQFFDRLQSTQELIYHQQVAADPVLLHFLETGEMTGRIADHVLYKDADFLLFIAPYYEPLFTVAILNSLEKQDVPTMEYLFSGPLLLDGEHITASYRRVLRYLKTMDNQLKATTESINNGAAYRWKYLVHYAQPTLIRLLNILPNEFNKWRSDYGISLINLALAIYTKDFKQGMKVLALAEALHTTDYVQERVQVRKKELLVYQKGRRNKHPIETLVGDFLSPGSRRWLRFLVILMATGVVLTFAVNITNKFNRDKKYSGLHAAKAEDLFAKAVTRTKMERLVAQLEFLLSGKAMDSIVIDTSFTAPHTGDDVYGPAFMTALSGIPYTAPAQPLKSRADSPGDVVGSAGDSTGFIDSLHKQSLRVFNRLEVAMVVLMQTPDSFYSCYIAAHDSTFVPLQQTANRVYFYIGQHWSMAKIPEAQDIDYRRIGYFRLTYKNANTFLRDGSLTFVLDPEYWRYSRRYIPLEIGVGEDKLFVNLLDNNANGVDLYLGE